MIRQRTLLHLKLLGVVFALSFWTALAAPAAEPHADANRLTYLDENDPFYVHLNFPKLTTPQWVGEAGVEAVVILAIDDLRETPKYETTLRPILERLKQIDGRAPVSIFCNINDAANPQFQAWLKEGLSLEVHTLTHPCPCLAGSNFVSAASNYHDCVDLLHAIPGNKPVAFRMPCCDSMNSPSPRFYAEIFNQASRAGQFLTIDSSVMNITTPRDTSLPRGLVLDAAGRERFRKYFPSETNQITRQPMGSFVTTIEDYPYPYVIGKLCWEFPPMVPSDWEANNVHGPTNSVTVADWKAALDATVLKQGVFTFIFHPHGWIRPAQMVEFIDYAVATYGKKVKFLNFRETQERLDRNLLAGEPLRAANGQDNGVRLLDVNNDGYLDVVIGNERARKTRLWNPKQNAWVETGFPTQVKGAQFGVLHPDGRAVAIKTVETSSQPDYSAWHFENGTWLEDKSLLNGLKLAGQPVLTSRDGTDRGVRLRDADNDGRCELLVGNETQNAVFGWFEAEHSWKKLAYSLPPGTSIVDAQGRDDGLRFVDINADGYADALFSNEKYFSLHQFVSKANPRLSWEVGWNDEVATGKRDASSPIPMIVRGGAHPDNGVWFHSRQMWVQNEDTASLPSVVDRRSFKQLLTADQPPSKSPQESLACIQVRPGFKVELVASEPLVVDPIAFEWGADGKLWVVEMGDYPLGVDGKGKPGGIVRFLEDTDRDGRYDRSTIFLDGVNFPTGIIPWRKGVIISTAPEIFYAEDTDGDGKADLRKTLFKGFNEGNQQHRVNGFDYGLDNWLYGANGESGGTVTIVGQASSLPIVGQASRLPVPLRGHDFRCQPDAGLFEPVAGQTQYGRHRDDWGNWFGNNNPTWLWHYFLPEHYLARNPQLAIKTTRQMLANYPESTRCFPISRTFQRFNDPAQFNHVTSGNSATPYRDELFGADFATSIFISEPVHNLIHREVLEPDGVTFKSHRAPDEQDTEFLRSTDNWFRPTMLKTGPDGALYIADMYRQVIEHPEWITKDIQQRLDLRAGADQGRLYRVYPEGAKLRPAPRLDKLDTAGLVAALDSANGWQRDTAERLLVQDGNKSTADPLRKLMSTSAKPKVRLQALHTLNALGLLSPEIAVAGLKDVHPAIRENSVQLCESFLHPSERGRPRPRGGNEKEAAAFVTPAPVAAALLQLTADPDARVRQQLAFTLGEWEDVRAAQALIKLAGDARLETAVLSSAPRHASRMLALLLADASPAGPNVSLVEPLIGLTAAQDDGAALAKTVREISSPRDGKYLAWQFAAMAGLLDGLERQKEARQVDLKSREPADLFAAARSLALDSKAAESERLQGVRLLGRGPTDQDEDLERLGQILRPEAPHPLQTAALAGLRRSSAARVADVVIAGWKGYAPSLRTEVLNLLFSRAEWIQALLTALEHDKISPAGIGAVHQQKLITHAKASIREQAVKLFSATRRDRQAVLKEYQTVEKLPGHPAKGTALFRQNCSPCHRFKGEGHEIGVDLNTLADKPLQTLLTAILDPNQAVEARYVNYTAMTKADHEISGVITAETATSITLRSPGGNEEVILRSDLKELASSGLSLMPEGFEKSINPQDMADLIAYILAR